MKMIKAGCKELVGQCGPELCALSEVVGPWLAAFNFFQQVAV